MGEITRAVRSGPMQTEIAVLLPTMYDAAIACDDCSCDLSSLTSSSSSLRAIHALSYLGCLLPMHVVPQQAGAKRARRVVECEWLDELVGKLAVMGKGTGVGVVMLRARGLEHERVR